MNIVEAKEKLSNKAVVKKLNSTDFRSYSGLILVILVVGTFLSFRSPNFLTQQNILNVLRQISVYGILACGQAFAMMTGGIDLQVGSVAGLCGAIVTKIVVGNTIGLVPAMIVGMVIGGILGLFAGFMIAKTGIPAFIMTLGLQISLRGVAYLICDGKPIGNLPENMLHLGVGSVAGIPVPILFMLASFVIIGIILSKTSFGRSVYAVGGNYQAAFHSGINAKRVIMLSYMISGILAALAGVILSARNASAQPTAGNAFETEAIAACAMGGVSFSGGKGAVTGIFLGALLMGIINNGMNLMYISSYWQLVVKGAIIVASVLYSIFSSKTK
ncbi:monosaccharide ABC transporter membrane protein (CUT2 family) [Hydrogenoanaerobacterium saccharovorans]|uniref:Monosaccharide ABC transporter membrane protein, CUT2 family n=1 Tax=Hydrogenoanaerobacterium saccharovorans TaxID=474960 RepID=A0A1H8EDF9_9FIRM|nr:ABC transporter permease [Hydrogenoanaerobacterium saccharovorans]RPF42045.1 monosaccharide ABC transporter membrane protein (CUT2 family) [Hydrogenoanaerobacterium saccharovorans]SEN16788.1 monosaccharide ABC transporter membrane protein, CUT2 family [Hydrogenoanaerobacterium saccharovorans]